MNKIFALLIGALISTGIFSAELCVQTYNTYGVFDRGDIFQSKLSSRTENILKKIEAKENCDLHHFQEVWMSKQSRKFTKYFLKKSYQSFRFKKLAKANIGLDSHTSAQVTTVNSLSFEHVATGGGRGLLKIKKGIALLNLVKDGLKLQSVNLHLHPPSHGPDGYLMNISQLVDGLKFIINNLKPDQPLIVSGDFNLGPYSDVLNAFKRILLLEDSFLQVNQSYHGSCTYCGLNNLSSQVIDYNLVRSGLKTKIETTKASIVLRSTRHTPLSDHRAVKTTFKLSKLSELRPSKKELQHRQLEVSESIRFLIKELSADSAKYSNQIGFLKALLNDLLELNKNKAYTRLVVSKP